jgi:hypothetical protein
MAPYESEGAMTPTRLVITVLVSTCMLHGVAAAQFDHLQCWKVKPDQKFNSYNLQLKKSFMLCAPAIAAGATTTTTSTSTSTTLACTDDVMQCPDGSYVSRDPLNNCQFYPCL